jgi:hypothetical protein
MEIWKFRLFIYTMTLVVLGGVMVVMLATGPKIREFKPGRERWIFKGDKNLQHDFIRRVTKPSVGPLSYYFAAH